MRLKLCSAPWYVFCSCCPKSVIVSNRRTVQDEMAALLGQVYGTTFAAMHGATKAAPKLSEYILKAFGEGAAVQPEASLAALYERCWVSLFAFTACRC